MQTNDLNKKSNLVISLILEKVVKFNDGYSKTNETTVEKFSQVDFVEMASSQFGLPLSETQKKKTLELNKSNGPLKVDNVNKIYNENLGENSNRIIEKTFNSICDNIVAAATNQSQAKSETKLSLCLKSTINIKSNIIFILCVLPCEMPPVLSFKALKFGNWMRNQISNKELNNESNVKNDYKEDSDVEVSPDVIEYTKRSSISSLNIYKNNSNNKVMNKQDDDIIYRNTMVDYKEQKELNNTSQNNHRNNYENDYHNTYTDAVENRKYNLNENEKSGKNQDLMKNKKIFELEKSILNLEGKKNKITNEIFSENQNISKQFSHNTSENYIYNSKTSKNFYEPHDFKQENMILNSDLIIFKEENSRLCEINKFLQSENENLKSKM